MKFAVSGLLAAFLFAEASAAADSKWTRLEGCKWMENGSNDGDSFHVQYRNKEFIFRLYFVDACESSEQVPERVQQQAKFLGISPDRVLEAGKVAKEVARKYLAGQSFTVVTRWEDAMGASRLPRNYAFVLFGKNDEHDLASTLIQNGLARIYGMPADPPGTVSAAQFQNDLRRLEASARQQHAGIYGDLDASTSAAGSGVTGGTAAATRATVRASYVPISMLLPASSHPPDVVDNPMDDELADYAVQVTEAPMVVQTGIPQGNYSEIPGWKPSPTPTEANPPETMPPAEQAPLPQPSSKNIAPQSAAPISLNHATEEELLSLPGIGAVYAGRIIAARPYKSVDDLSRVPGIGKKKVEQLRPLLAP